MGKEITKSPLPRNKKNIPNGMDFYSALKEVAEGKKIRRLEWEEDGFYCMLLNGVLSLHKSDGKDYQWVISDGDINGVDWVITK